MRFMPITPVVKNLLIINGLIFLAVYALSNAYPWLPNFLSLHHWSSSQFQPFQVITHAFMHGSISHLLGNALGIYVFGSMLEQRWGGKFFLSFYFTCAIGAAFVYIGWRTYELYQMEALLTAFRNTPTDSLFYTFRDQWINGLHLTEQGMKLVGDLSYYDGTDPQWFKAEASALMNSVVEANRDSPMIGASGALFGILMAAGLVVGEQSLMLLFLPVPIKVKYFVMFYGGGVLWSLLNTGAGDNVAHFAHLGGMIFGFLLIKILKLR